jgi:exodeoxyribonuclease VII large subunit
MFVCSHNGRRAGSATKIMPTFAAKLNPNAPTMSPRTSISLLALQQIITQCIESLPSAYWITAEIGELRVSVGGHCYMELVQHDDDSQRITARAAAVIWANLYRMLAPLFAVEAGAELAVGMKIMVRAQPQYHHIYGLQLNIVDIDPAYTAGEAALQRNRTIARLRSEGILDMNKELTMPLLPQRVAVISSEQAAGYRDFMEQLHKNPYGYRFRTTLYAAVVQGVTAEASIMEAMNNIYERKDDFDVVAILRGGGAQSDLACFDGYDLAYLITQFPLPVLTGIGHDKDISVADMAAHTMLKTPTAAAEFLIEQLAEQERYLEQLRKYTVNACALALERNYARVQNYAMRIKLGTSRICSVQKERVERYLPQRIRRAMEQRLQQERTKLRHLRSKVELLNPRGLLERGYCVAKINGKTLRSVEQVVAGGILQTILVDGVVDSKVEVVHR